MSQSTLFKPFDGEIQEFFRNADQLTFLMGAGISMESPSNIGSATEISRALLEYCAPFEEVEKLMGLDTLRYEMVVERVQGSYDAYFPIMLILLCT